MDNSKRFTSSTFRVDCSTWNVVELGPVVLPSGGVFLEIPFAAGELR